MIEWIFPVKCPICNEIVVPKGNRYHLDCIVKLEFLTEPFCKKCGVPITSEEQEYCMMCILEDRGWDVGRSIFYYRGIAKRVLYEVKQEGTKEIICFFALQMKKTQKDYIQILKPNCLVPVPLHLSKFRKRGFNQAELLAREFGKQVNIPVRLLLKKKQKTKDQKKFESNREEKEYKKCILCRYCRDKKWNTRIGIAYG